MKKILLAVATVALLAYGVSSLGSFVDEAHATAKGRTGGTVGVWTAQK